jgi:hypothetical protein
MSLHIPFHTLAERHLVYAYLAVALLQGAYALHLALQWRKTRAYAPKSRG